MPCCVSHAVMYVVCRCARTLLCTVDSDCVIYMHRPVSGGRGLCESNDGYVQCRAYLIVAK